MRQTLWWSTVLILAGCATGVPPRPELGPTPTTLSPPATAHEPAAPAAAAEPAAAVLDPSKNPASTKPEPQQSAATPPLATAAAADEGRALSERPLRAAELAALNDERLLEVYRGMPRSAVERLMDLRQGERPLNPFRREWLRDQEGRLYEVLYYLTREPPKGRTVGGRELTPVVFRDDKVYAIGRYPLKKLKSTACVVASAAAACLGPRR